MFLLFFIFSYFVYIICQQYELFQKWKRHISFIFLFNQLGAHTQYSLFLWSSELSKKAAVGTCNSRRGCQLGFHPPPPGEPFGWNILLLQITWLPHGVAVGSWSVITRCPDRWAFSSLIHKPAHPTKPRQNVQYLYSQGCGFSTHFLNPQTLSASVFPLWEVEASCPRELSKNIYKRKVGKFMLWHTFYVPNT